MQHLPCEIIETQPDVNASIIWLHGLGANGHDFVPIVPELHLPKHLGIRFIFPHAPSIPVTINGGMVMPAWYDILSMSIEREIDETQIMASAQAIHHLIEREIEKGIASERIILAGFSQGGAVAYQAALSYPKPLAGLIAMSTYFATYKTIAPHESNKSLPIHIFHGEQDHIVPESLGLHARQTLDTLGYTTSYRSYAMEHSVHPKEIEDISRNIQALLV